MSDVARLHPEKMQQTIQKDSVALKLVTLLSARQEAIQRKQARETIMTKEYFCAPGDNVQNLCDFFFVL